METTILGTIFELYLMITLLQSIACYLLSGHLNKYDHLFQTATRPFPGQGVGSGIVPRLYLNIVI